jgi:hypothetical protein
MNLKHKLVRRDKEGHFKLIKGATCQQEITIMNFSGPKVGACNLIKHKLTDLKSQIDPSIVVVGDLNTLLSPIDRSSSQKINK